MITRRLACALLAGALPAAALAQTGGFVATLGTDTVHVERFTQRGNRVDGVIVTRSPETRRITYGIEFGTDGALLLYQATTMGIDGTPLLLTGRTGNMRFTADSAIREIMTDTAVVRVATVGTALPWPLLPYTGLSYLVYEFGNRQARQGATPAGEASWNVLTFLPTQRQPQRVRVWPVGSDSLEVDYFGQGRHGYRFDRDGRLLRADWTGTTYRYRVSRVGDVDIDAIQRSWAAADARGAKMGSYSPRDSVTTAVGSATINFAYGRPAKRGRTIWGEVVPFGKVWRLGADFATHMTTSHALRIGEAEIPAGSYTLWMMPTSATEALLVVNKATRIFGTQYNPANDLVRIPLRASSTIPTVERLTIDVESGTLRIRWDTVTWSVPVVVRQDSR